MFDLKKAFTLIELMVVIAIIGIIASIVLVSVVSVGEKARDAVRKLDLTQIQKALEVYQIDNDSYPSTGGSWWGVCTNGGSRDRNGANAYIPGITPTYFAELPVDPLDVRTDWSGYLYRSDGNNYKLLAHSTGPESFPSAGESFYDPIRPTWAWMLCSGEPACSSW